jgi:hypothetical protein
MNERARKALRELSQQHPDLFPRQKMEQFIMGLPADSEFGPVRAANEGCCVSLPVSCAEWGGQNLQITLEGSGSITSHAREMIQMIRDHWQTIWEGAMCEWFRVYPERVCPEGIHVEWILEATLPAVQSRGANYWELGISGDAATTVLALRLKGSEVSSAELL